MTAAAQTASSSTLDELAAVGQSVWIDFLSRDLIRTGGLSRLIDAGVSGVTTNPTILEHAVTGSDAYDEQLRDLAAIRLDADAALLELAASDVIAACDALADVWCATKGRDGFVSWEVNPALADRVRETVEEAHFLADRVGRPNLLVKIPATPAGVRAFEEATAAGLSVNMTLIFTLARYTEVLTAYSRGLARAADAGHDLAAITSVASVFVSRLDVLTDARLTALGTPSALRLRGRLGVASAKLAYRLWQASTSTAHWGAVRDRGARPQRCLWASTGTKDPRYSDVMYVEELVGPSTVTTLPQETLAAFLDHGHARPTLVNGVESAVKHLEQLRALGIDAAAIGAELEQDGVRHFRRSQSAAIEAVAATMARAESA